MHRVWIEGTTQVLEREKAAHASESTATVIGGRVLSLYMFQSFKFIRRMNLIKKKTLQLTCTYIKQKD
jgi:hypothetical protein